MCQPIRDQGGHIEFGIDLKTNNTWSGLHKEQRTPRHGIISLELFSSELKTEHEQN